MWPLCPQPPDWRPDWAAIEEALPCVRALQGCPQDPRHHAEGDVLVHTRMVCEQMSANRSWRGLPEDARDVLFWSALLHDVAKPECTRREADGRITSRGHVRLGAATARRLLWEMGTRFEDREQVFHLVRYHALPFWLIERAAAARTLHLASQNVRPDRLTLLAEADARGRICDDTEPILEKIALFGELARDERCFDGPRAFASPHARFLYARQEWPHCDFAPFEGFGSEVVLMSGFPGVGKDTWIREHLQGWPVVSLDEIRRRLGVTATEQQGRVRQAAREEAREHLRRGASFVWNATNLSRRIRNQCIELFASYRAHIRIVYLEASPETLRRQNRERPETVPDKVMERLFRYWEVPEPAEGHRVEHWVEGRLVAALTSR